jgi:hypothetical protein
MQNLSEYHESIEQELMPDSRVLQILSEYHESIEQELMPDSRVLYSIYLLILRTGTIDSSDYGPDFIIIIIIWFN